VHGAGSAHNSRQAACQDGWSYPEGLQHVTAHITTSTVHTLDATSASAHHILTAERHLPPVHTPQPGSIHAGPASLQAQARNTCSPKQPPILSPPTFSNASPYLSASRLSPCQQPKAWWAMRPRLVATMKLLPTHSVCARHHRAWPNACTAKQQQ
jgi:hypothetical protein